MKIWNLLFTLVAAFACSAQAATINWSAGINHGFSLENGDVLPAGSLVRLGWFRFPSTGVRMTDSEIQALKTTPEILNNHFVEAGRTVIGNGFTPAIGGHFAATMTIDASGNGPALAGKQMYLWVIDTPTLEGVTQQAILYWNVGDVQGNPDGTADKPGSRWRFPTDVSFPVATTIDVTDLTVGIGGLGSGARLVVGTYPRGVSGSTGASNFGLSDLDQPLDVTTPSVLAGGSVGVSYSHSLAAVEGHPGYTWALESGALPHGLSLSSEGIISGRPTFAGTYNFVVRASDATPSSVTKPLTISIASIPLVITSASDLPEAGPDSSYALSLTAEGGIAPYSWTRVAGALPAGITLSSEGVLSGTPTVAGISEFTVRCTDAGGLEITKDLTLNVRAIEIVTASALNNAFLNVPFAQALEAKGGKAPYTWSLDSGALPAGLNLSSAGLLSYTPAAIGTFGFTLKVTDDLGHVATRTFTLNVMGALVVPEIVAPSFPAIMVGQDVSFQLAATNNPKKYVAKGLPLGLRLNAATGLITGRTKVPGVFAVKFSASNPSGQGPILEKSLEVQALPNGAVGTFMGVIAHNVSLNGNLGGRFDLKTTSLGSYSLKLTQGSKSQKYSGLMDVAVNEDPQITIVSKNVKIVLTLDANSHLLTGVVTNFNAEGSSASLAGWRQVWKASTNPATTRQGYYSVGIDITANTGSAPVPRGTGYAKCVVGVDGKLTISGKTADGNSITTSGFVGPNGEALLYQILYSKRGSLVGRLVITPDSGGLYTENVITGALTWLKPADSSRIYPQGFGPLTMGVYGKYLSRASVFWNLTGMPNPTLPASLIFNDGGVEESVIVPNVASFTFTNTGKVTMPTGGAAENPGNTTLVIPFSSSPSSTANGMFKGKFRLVDDKLVRNVAYQGMIIRSADGLTKAYGYFLLPQIPAASERPNQTPILSGQVTIRQ